MRLRARGRPQIPGRRTNLHQVTKRLLWGLGLLFAFVLIWRKVRIVFFVHVDLWQLALLFLIVGLAIYVVFESLLESSGSN